MMNKNIITSITFPLISLTLACSTPNLQRKDPVIPSLEYSKNLQLQIERTNKSYYDIIQHYSQSNSDFGGKIFDINGKLFNEINTITSLNDDKNKLSKDLFKFILVTTIVLAPLEITS